MKRPLLLVTGICTFVGFCHCTLLLGQEASQDTSQDISPSASSNEAANSNEVVIRKSIASYVEAFNKGDAKAVASHWNDHGEFMTPEGDQLLGRQQLEDHFAAYFKKAENAKIELLNTAIKSLSPSVAQETGIARVIVPGQEPSETDYEAIHVKTPMGWKIDSVREQQRPEQVLNDKAPTHEEHLQALDWLVGSWVDTEENTTIETKCRWTTNQNFLVRSFKVVIEDRINFEGTQIIGWDAHAETIRSWTFDSDGGFGVGRWSGDGDRWTVSTLNVLPDGRRASSTNIYDRIDENNMQFRSIGRQIDGELMPRIDPVSVVRVSDQIPSPQILSPQPSLLEDSTP